MTRDWKSADWRHCTPVALGVLVEQDRKTTWRGDKPHGFWISPEEATQTWKTYATEADIRDIPGSYEYRVLLPPDGKYLWLDTDAKIREFWPTYGKPDEWRGGYITHSDIDWPRVIAEWDGIMIPDWRWGEATLEGWYSTWDCGSGCIWRPRGLGLELLRKPEAKPKKEGKEAEEECQNAEELL